MSEKPQRKLATNSAFCGQCGAPSSWDSVDISFRTERQKPTGTITADLISEIKMEVVNDHSISLDSNEEDQ